MFVKEGIPEVACGVGLNSGICVAGNLGARDRFAFSLIGTPCNIAARLESSTKTVGVGCLIGEETAKHSKIPLKLLEPLSVKGIDKPLKVFTWIDQIANFAELIAINRAGLRSIEEVITKKAKSGRYTFSPMLRVNKNRLQDTVLTKSIQEHKQNI